MGNMFKVNNKNTRMTLMILVKYEHVSHLLLILNM